jgi:hypothetical protein
MVDADQLGESCGQEEEEEECQLTAFNIEAHNTSLLHKSIAPCSPKRRHHSPRHHITSSSILRPSRTRFHTFDSDTFSELSVALVGDEEDDAQESRGRSHSRHQPASQQRVAKHRSVSFEISLSVGPQIASSQQQQVRNRFRTYSSISSLLGSSRDDTEGGEDGCVHSGDCDVSRRARTFTYSSSEAPSVLLFSDDEQEEEEVEVDQIV